MSTTSENFPSRLSINNSSPSESSNDCPGGLDQSRPETQQPPFKPTLPFILAFSSICIITLAAALDATSLSIALPIITDHLHGTAIEAFWAGTSFLLTSAVFQPVIAGLSHAFGRKDLVIGTSVLFAVGSVVAATAKDLSAMYVALRRFAKLLPD